MRLVSMLAALAAPVAADPALAQEDVRWTQSPMVFFPGQIEAGEGVVEEDASIIDVPFL